MPVALQCTARACHLSVSTISLHPASLPSVLSKVVSTSESRRSDGVVARYCRSIGLALFEDWHGVWRGWGSFEKRCSSTEAMISSPAMRTGLGRARKEYHE